MKKMIFSLVAIAITAVITVPAFAGDFDASGNPKTTFAAPDLATLGGVYSVVQEAATKNEGVVGAEVVLGGNGAANAQVLTLPTTTEELVVSGSATGAGGSQSLVTTQNAANNAALNNTPGMAYSNHVDLNGATGAVSSTLFVQTLTIDGATAPIKTTFATSSAGTGVHQSVSPAIVQ